MTKSKEATPLETGVVESIAKDCSLRAQRGEFAVEYSTHAREQMENRNIDQKHVLQVLEFGRLVEDQTRFDAKENDHSYLLRDQNVEDRDMAVSIAITKSGNQKVIIVTAMLVDPLSGKYL